MDIQSLSADAVATLKKFAGKRPDREVATRAGVSIEQVRAYRKQHKVGAYVPNPVPAGAPPAKEVARTPKVDLTPFIGRMGRVPDEDIANEAGVSRGTVKAFRMARGIPPYDAYKWKPSAEPVVPVATKPEPEPEPEPELEEEPEPQPTPVPSRSVKPIKLKPAKGDRVEQPPAKTVTVPAPAPAPKRAVAPAPVAAPPPAAAQRPAVAGPRRRGPPSRLAEFEHLVGTIPDSEVAAKAGLKPNTVSKWRIAHGIPPASRSAVARPAPRSVEDVLPPEPGETVQVPAVRVQTTSKAAAQQQQRSPQLAYRIIVTWAEQRREYVVLGADLPHAASRAHELLAPFGAWTIEQVLFLGEALN